MLHALAHAEELARGQVQAVAAAPFLVVDLPQGLEGVARHQGQAPCSFQLFHLPATAALEVGPSTFHVPLTSHCRLPGCPLDDVGDVLEGGAQDLLLQGAVRHVVLR
eukprot:10666808-Alexandrium_andersonii.AAC.1